jgi:hypothetical protein
MDPRDQAGPARGLAGDESFVARPLVKQPVAWHRLAV